MYKNEEHREWRRQFKIRKDSCQRPALLNECKTQFTYLNTKQPQLADLEYNIKEFQAIVY